MFFKEAPEESSLPKLQMLKTALLEFSKFTVGVNFCHTLALVVPLTPFRTTDAKLSSN